MEVISPEEIKVAEEQSIYPGVICPFCKDPIHAGHLSACNDCGTLYHRVCFVENVSCAVFGCKGVVAPEKIEFAELMVQIEMLRHRMEMLVENQQISSQKIKQIEWILKIAVLALNILCTLAIVFKWGISK